MDKEGKAKEMVSLGRLCASNFVDTTSVSMRGMRDAGGERKSRRKENRRERRKTRCET